ncbi:trypsin-like serine peptidase [Streptomyces sp. NPDC086091]|uniref:trypsin-like serine peptidase n=1 Tax=Streptomyces sp. NPDC086091 TaxID=3365751 RepID=UPI0038130590
MSRGRIIALVAAVCVVSLAVVTVFTGLPERLGIVSSAGQSPDGGREGGWKDWDPAAWARGNDDFVNPVVAGLWSESRMRKSASTDQPVAKDIGADQGVTDPEPVPVAAEPVPQPYQKNAPVIGKLFFDTPEGPSVCSATVVTDPARPGASDLVWTAGHCVHAGAEGGWFRNIVFVPSYNDGATPGDESSAPAAPFGTWWADEARTSEQWIAEGADTGGAGSPFDFAVLRVKRTGSADTRSLEETVGAAAKVGFDAPNTQQLSTVGIWGYPAADPFDGERMFTCRSKPGRLSIRSDQPSLLRIGCTMTGGSSGGGWFTEDTDGRPLLVSNTSIGPEAPLWLAGPRLGPEAEKVYRTVSQLPS